MKQKLKRVYSQLPSFCRALLRPVKFLYFLYYHVLWMVRPDVWLIEAKEKNSGEKFFFGYAGSESVKNYAVSIVSDESARQNYLGKQWFWKVTGLVQTQWPECSLIMFEVPRGRQKIFRMKTEFKVPVWVKVEIPLDLLGSLMKKKKYLEMQRKIRKHGLDYEFCKDPASFDEFYYRIYLPYISGRHGNRAEVFSHEYLWSLMKDCEIVFIKKDNLRVAGCMVEMSKSKGTLLVLGIREGNEGYLKMGVLDAVYFFALKHFQENGMTTANLGHARTFFKDGCLTYKRRLGGMLSREPLPESGYLTMKWLHPSRALKNFLADNPFLTLDSRGGYLGIVFAQRWDPVFWENWLKEYHCDGIKKYVVFVFDYIGGTFSNTEKLSVFPAAPIFQIEGTGPGTEA